MLVTGLGPYRQVLNTRCCVSDSCTGEGGLTVGLCLRDRGKLMPRFWVSSLPIGRVGMPLQASCPMPRSGNRFAMMLVCQRLYLLIAGHVQQGHRLLGHEGQVVAEQVLVLLRMNKQLRAGQLVGLCRLKGHCTSKLLSAHNVQVTAWLSGAYAAGRTCTPSSCVGQGQQL